MLAFSFKAIWRQIRGSANEYMWLHSGGGDEDRLLDRQVRRYFRDEFGSVRPPAGVFPRLLRSLRERQARREVPRLGATMRAAYSRLSSAKMVRISNSVAALALLLVVLGTIYSRPVMYVQPGHNGYLLSTSADGGRETETKTRDLKDVAAPTTLGRYSYDPIELGASTPMEHHATSNYENVTNNPQLEQPAPIERVTRGQGF